MDHPGRGPLRLAGYARGSKHRDKENADPGPPDLYNSCKEARASSAHVHPRTVPGERPTAPLRKDIPFSICGWLNDHGLSRRIWLVYSRLSRIQVRFGVIVAIHLLETVNLHHQG